MVSLLVLPSVARVRVVVPPVVSTVSAVRVVVAVVAAVVRGREG